MDNIKNFDNWINESADMSSDLKPKLIGSEYKEVSYTEKRFQFPNTEFKDEYILRIYSDDTTTFHYGDGLQIDTTSSNDEYLDELRHFEKSMLDELNLEEYLDEPGIIKVKPKS